MKLITFFVLIIFTQSMYGQSACSAQYDFTMVGDSNTCVYTFTPNTFPGSPSVCSIDWVIGSTGTYGLACDPGPMTANPLTYSFCFDGYYNITMNVRFCSGAYCYVTKVLYVRCLGATKCDPDPNRITSIPDPKVEITYIEPDTCNFSSGSPVSGCMSYGNGMNGYYISCGWKWAIRVHPSSCNFFTYYVQYDSIRSCGNYSCVTRSLDTNIICIKAYIDRPIYIVATAFGCCIPAGYQRGYIWTPSPDGGVYTIIDDPDPIVSVYCSAYRHCTNYTYCTENPQTMNQTSGWPGTTCFWAGNKTEQRDNLKAVEHFNIEQNIVIYNIQGKEVFKGRWIFGDPSNLYLNWPDHITSGLYFIKFQHSTEKSLVKLYKF
ncbi:MAG: T9SS type A sorting domain-containing protein [Saprospiraceae bacterium]|nr:T9SS type A sorting domain-containing protein [Saprospiraceae bacterium]MBK9222088.1 T9SS type A sorting domain-containing protein [Saprospiraceae bacterium]MBK9721003.1 T9SS type A sorting domain-containing protein [Saprospiraceae bacterium]